MSESTGGRVPILSIAGSDSGGGAGIQADLRAIDALGGWGMTALTSLTAQSPQGVFGIHDVPPQFVVEQMEVVLRDLGAAAIKTGMLSQGAIIRAVAGKLRDFRARCSVEQPAYAVKSPPWPPTPEIDVSARDEDGQALELPPSPWAPPFKLVVDPVMVATSGARLLQEDSVAALRDELLPLATVLTPNIPEAEVLCGHAIHDEESLMAAGRHIHQQMMAGRGGEERPWLLLKGGHLAGAEAVDWLYDGRVWLRFATPWVDAPESATHGTGCTYASALATALAQYPVYTATALAKAHITRRLRGG